MSLLSLMLLILSTQAKAQKIETQDLSDLGVTKTIQGYYDEGSRFIKHGKLKIENKNASFYDMGSKIPEQLSSFTHGALVYNFDIPQHIKLDFTASYKHGKLNGPYIIKIDNFSLVEANYKDGELHGRAKVYSIVDNKIHKVLADMTYEQGLRTTIKHYDENDALTENKIFAYDKERNKKIKTIDLLEKKFSCNNELNISGHLDEHGKISYLTISPTGTMEDYHRSINIKIKNKRFGKEIYPDYYKIAEDNYNALSKMWDHNQLNSFVYAYFDQDVNTLSCSDLEAKIISDLARSFEARCNYQNQQLGETCSRLNISCKDSIIELEQDIQGYDKNIFALSNEYYSIGGFINQKQIDSKKDKKESAERKLVSLAVLKLKLEHDIKNNIPKTCDLPDEDKKITIYSMTRQIQKTAELESKMSKLEKDINFLKEARAKGY